MNRFRGLPWRLFRFFLLIGMGYVLIFPLLYTLSASFRPLSDVMDPSIIWLPKHFTLMNFIDTYKALDYAVSLLFTVKIGVVSSLLQIASCAVVGYGFARHNFKEKKILFALVILTIIIPPQTTMIPGYMQFRFFNFFGLSEIIKLLTGKYFTVNLIDTVWTFYLPSIFGMGIRSGLFIYIFRQFFRGMPKELEDSSKLDGCGALATFLRVMIPNAGAAFLTVFLFSMVWHWNDYYLSVMYLYGSMPLSVRLVGLEGTLYMLTDSLKDFNVNNPFSIVSRIQAGCLLTILPMLILYIFSQKYFTESIERTGIIG